MRAQSILILTLLVTVPLAGCIDGLLVGPDQAQRPAAVGPGWVEVPLPAVRPQGGVIGIWVPEGATWLRVDWPAVTDPSANWTAPGAFGLPASPDKVAIHGPNGERLFLGGPDTVHPNASGIHGRALDLPQPVPGLYVFAFHGDITPPTIRVHLDDDTVHPRALPLPYHFERHLLVPSFTATNGFLNVQTTLDPPPFVHSVHPDIIGTGAGGYVAVRNVTGDQIAQVDIPVTSPPGMRDVSFGLDPGSFVYNRTSDVEALTTGQWHIDARLLGAGTAFAWLGVSADPGAPHAATPAQSPSSGSSTRFTLAGAVQALDGAWFDMPENGLFVPRYDGDGANRFRVYDTEGTRLLWDTVVDTGGPYPLPEGRLLVINDGPHDLQVDLIGRPGADSALHAVGHQVREQTVTHEPTPGWFEDQADARLPGPVLSWFAGRAVGHSSDLHVTVSSDAGTLATVPQWPENPYDSFACCPIPLVTISQGDAHWLDGGAYTITATGSEAQGSTDIMFVHIDLESAHDEDAPVADPDRPLPWA